MREAIVTLPKRKVCKMADATFLETPFVLADQG